MAPQSLPYYILDMKLLDGDDGGLTSSRGVRASRDIVQFVRCSTFALLLIWGCCMSNLYTAHLTL
jgi:hypothetical protein